MNAKRNKILKRNLITLLKIFDGKPNLLAQYLLDYDVLGDNVKSKIMNNKELAKRSKELKDNGEVIMPNFTNLEEMNLFFDRFFESTATYLPVLVSDAKIETLLAEIKTALKREDYEKAAKLRDYCATKGIDIADFL